MKLQAFLPYRLAVLSEAVSRCISQVYQERFDLGRDEWRVLAALAESGRMKSTAAGLHTTLDKMQVSRACASLETKGLIAREADPSDRRNKLLYLTRSGHSLMDQLLPLVLAREAELLAGLDPSDRQALDKTIDQLLARARGISQQP